MNKDVDDIGLAILLPRKKIRFCPHNDRRIWHLRRQLSTNAEQIYSYRALHNTCPRSLSNNSNPTPVVFSTTTTMNSNTLSSHRVTKYTVYISCVATKDHRTARVNIITSKASNGIFHKHFLRNEFYNSTTDTTTKCLPNNSIENCLRQNEYYYLENDTTVEDIITPSMKWSWSLWHAICIELKATFT